MSTTEPTSRAGDAEPSLADQMDKAPEPQGTGRRLDRETWSMLVVPPVLVALVFAGFVWWRQTADLDSTELNQLQWSTIWSLIVEHVQVTAVSAVAVVLVAVPLGVALTRGPLRRAAPLVVGFANAGQAAPSIGLIVLLAIWVGFGFWTAVLALTLYGVLPVLRNTITGLQGVDPTLVEAGRGLGMSSAAVLVRVELPLAVPVIMAGVRTALVLLVGTAALATFINAGGLGAIVDAGISNYRFSLMIAGAVLIALLALLVEWLGRLLELATRPKGL
ncbi:osmoprotectant transport system permease protein [Nocardioides marinisabuli]|uniref:Osmoprotectant transport system permease protein n=1 Tax=Nocardioides marinisabuli TaxID=419476 RepID=A0A7Y9JR36_9ACTN|nr:ABC transporter permease [Nocardioides marinisabuli]NYD57816.1 osmoprotectant transport system permease protein [Nocardioides marinisabuli]